MKRGICTALLAAVVCSHASAEDWVKHLGSPDIAVRRSAIDRIQTLEDARIPEACLALLTDEGRSIRRQAARAIGSRFHQVPGERVPAFVAALKQCAKDGPQDVTFVAYRAMGLLTRRFDGEAFSVSPDGRWVLFEERRLPVIADKELKQLQKLSPVHPDRDMISFDTEARGGQIEPLDRKSPLLKLMGTNASMQQLFSPHWHPKGDAVALQPMIQRRFYTPIVLWRASDGAVRTWSVTSFKDLYGRRFPHWGSTTDFVKWDGRRAVIHIYDADNGGDPNIPYDPKGIRVSVDIDKWKTRLE